MLLRVCSFLLFFVGMGSFGFADVLQNVVVKSAWSRATPPRASAGVVYLTLVNIGEKEISLMGVEADVAMHAMLHTTKKDAQGRVSMMHAEKFIIPPKGEINLAPGGHHIMLMGLKKPLVSGTEIGIKLLFDGGEFKQIRVPVKALRYRLIE